MAFLDEDDLAAFAEISVDKAAAMIEDATSLAMLVAPCLADEDLLTPAQLGAVKAVLRGAILRWHEAGQGVRTQQTAGPFSQSTDTTMVRRGMFWPSEITTLQDICKGDDTSGAFAIDTAPTRGLIHADTCSLRFGASYCSCGAVLTGLFPLYGVVE